MAKYLKSLVCSVDPRLYPVFTEEVTPFSTNLVADAYFDALDRVATEGIAKIIVQFDDRPEADGRVNDMVDVLEIRKYLDPVRYAALEPHAKRIELAALVRAGTVALAKARGWDPSPFERAYEKVTATGVSLGGPMGKPATSPDKKRRAQLEYAYERGIDVYVEILDIELGHKERVLFAKLIDGLHMIAAVLGPMKWLSNEELEIQHKNKQDRWLVKIGEKPTSEFITERAARDDPHGLYDLGMNYVNGYLVPQNLERARFWLERAAARGYPRAPAALAKLGS